MYLCKYVTSVCIPSTYACLYVCMHYASVYVRMYSIHSRPCWIKTVFQKADIYLHILPRMPQSKYQYIWKGKDNVLIVFTRKPSQCLTEQIWNVNLIKGYCKFEKDCVSLIFAFLAFSLGRKIKIRND